MNVTPTICLVDDDQAVQQSLSMFIHSIGYISRCFSTGKQFLEEYRSGQCDCLMLDVRLPGEDGLEILSAIREQGNEFPIMIISGHCDSVDRERVMKLGADELIEKPWRAKELQELLSRAVSAGKPE